MSGRARPGPLVLAILDGWGERAERRGNALALAQLPNWHRMLGRYPHALLQASGEAVGLPRGVIGNSEVGHLNLGSGRVVPQGVVVINEAIADGSFASNPVLADVLAHARAEGGAVHLLGLVSDGNVHSALAHLFALVAAVAEAELPLVVHAFGDGRDVPPRSMANDLDALDAQLASHGRAGAIASLTGRFYAMDRDRRWERIELAYRALAEGKAPHRAPNARAALEAAYARGESDEFIVPTIVGEARPLRDGDAAIFFNFRPDRARELTLAFCDPSFSEFAVRRYQRLVFATMTKYEESFPNPVLFGPRPQAQTFGELVAAAGLRQLRLAETEKYAHVTYFFNGGREEVFAGEDRVLIPSDRSVATYDLAPTMRAREITAAALEDIAGRRHDVIVMNYANADMVGHTGNLAATVAGAEVLDEALGALERAVLAADGILAVTADHGNAEEKLDEAGGPLTAHTTNPVPLVLVAREPPLGALRDGKLGDVAPTLLPLLGIAVPPAMSGENLLARSPARTP
ncbi:MAG: 2,3-bisphosphoglycerate-independent phosphoglycerate mutase [Vulcanimicrobiaceae bacterium]